MARRAMDFATAHPMADASYTAVVTRLQAEVAQADMLGKLQGTGRERERAAIARRTAIRRATRSQQLRRLCRIADLAAVDHPELVGKFILPPPKGPNRSFLLKAETMLADATTEKDRFISLGLGDTFIEELTQAVADFNATTASAHAARADHVGARAELVGIVNQCAADIDVIDTFIRSKFANDLQALAAWQSAKNIPGPFTSQVATTPPPAVEPVTPPAPATPASVSAEKAS